MARWKPFVAVLALACIGSSILLGQTLQRGKHYFAVQELDSSRVIMRGNTESAGMIHPTNSLFLGANRAYRHWLLQARSLEVGYVDLVTPNSGRTFVLEDIFLGTSQSPDNDQDGLHDEAELIVGTNASNPDSDGDGIPDGLEVIQGFNPLDGINATTGILGTTPANGTITQVEAANHLAFLCSKTAGVTIVNIFNGLEPRRVSVVPLTGESFDTALSGDKLAIARGINGLSIADISKLSRPTIRHHIPLSGRVHALVAFCDQVLAGSSDGSLYRIDMRTGSVLASWSGLGPIHDLALFEDHLYVLTATALRIYRLGLVTLEEVAQLTVTGSPSPLETGRKLFVGGDYAYVGYFEGYKVIDLTDPTQPQQVGAPPVVQDAIHGIVANGSGRILATTSSLGTASLIFSQFDASDPSDVTRFINSIPTPGDPRGLAIHDGLAYVADSDAGLQVINTNGPDTFGIAPSISLASNALESIAENAMLRLTARAIDDVLVRDVAFYLDGQLLFTDGNFPFEFRLCVPAYSSVQNLTLQARAFDTAGNASWSAELPLAVTPDNDLLPQVVSSQPLPGSSQVEVSTITAAFNKSMDPATIDSTSFQVRYAGTDGLLNTGDDQLFTPTEIGFLTNPFTLTARFEPSLPGGGYEVTVTQTTVDYAGQALATPFIFGFSVAQPSLTAFAPPDLSVSPYLNEFSANFSLDLDPTSVTSNALTLEEAGPDTLFDTADDQLLSDGILVYLPSENRALRRFPAGLRSGRYRATAHAALRDTGGNALFNPTQWTFQVTAPQVVAMTPLANAQEPTVSEVLAHFSVPMSGANLNAASFTLTEWGPDGVFDTDDDIPLPPAALALVAGGQTLRLAYDSGLPSGTFRASVQAGLTDLNGQPLESQVSWLFSVDPPLLLSHYPLESDEVAALTQIAVNFDKPMAPGSFLPTSFLVEEAGLDGSFDTGDDVFIGDGTITPSTTSVSRVFADGLHSGNYRVRLTDAITDTLGHSITPFAWTFTNLGGTTLTGVAQFADGTPAEQATVQLEHVTLAKRTTTTAADGSFRIIGVDIRNTQILRIAITKDASGVLFKGAADVHDFVLDGTTNAGTIVLRSFCDPLFTPDLFPFEAGLNGPVSSLLGYNDGTGEALWIGGRFSEAAGQAVNNIARWRNGTYSALGSGFDEEVKTLLAFDDGSGQAVFAGGRFLSADGSSANHIARWDGAQWHPLGLGLNNPVYAMVAFDDGQGSALYVGGNFSLAGGIPSERIARWKNGAWEAVGDGFDGPIYALTVYDDGQGPRLVAGGNFYNSGAHVTPNIARFINGAWEALGDGLNGQVNALAVFDEGSGPTLIAGGSFSATDQGLPLLAIARFDGSSWSGLGNGLVGSGGGGHKREGKTPFGSPGQVAALQVFDGGSGPALYVAGTFDFAGGAPAHHIARWQGGAWWPLAQGITGTPNPFDYPLFATCFGSLSAATPMAKLYLGGPFDAVDYQTSHYLAEITCDSAGKQKSTATQLGMKGDAP